MTRMIRSMLAATALLVPAASFAQAVGPDAAACQPGGGPAIAVTITGLKDRKGDVRLELYPATAEDFLRASRELVAQEKVFRRVSVTPSSVAPAGPVTMCIRVPRPGRYGLMMIHSREAGRTKFDYRVDGAGTPSNKRLGFGKPRLDEATVNAGAGITPVTIKAQYLGLFGFSAH